MTEEYEYTQDWFHWAPEVWEKITPILPGRKAFLELGSFEGRAAVWIVENMMEDGGVITCVDTWAGGAEHTEVSLVGAEDRFDKNIALVKELHPNKDVISVKGTTYLALKHMSEGTLFDFIYIDASHEAKDVMTDGCMAWPLLKAGGVMVFDDYLWGQPRDVLFRPKIAVDAFTTMFAEELSIVHVGYQFIVKKN